MDDGDYEDPVTGLVRPREYVPAPLSEGLGDPFECFPPESEKLLGSVLENLEEYVQEALRSWPKADPKVLRGVFQEVDPEWASELLACLTTHPGKRRPWEVLRLLLEKGSVIEEEVLTRSGTPEVGRRAMTDLEETGLIVKKGSDGRYRIDAPNFRVFRESEGAILRKDLLELRQAEACSICPATYDKYSFQGDHRLPHKLVGQKMYKKEGVKALQLLCVNCNNRKRAACKSCSYFQVKDHSRCGSCRWAYPENFTHIAGLEEKILEVVAKPDQYGALERVRNYARDLGLSI